MVTTNMIRILLSMLSLVIVTTSASACTKPYDRKRYSYPDRAELGCKITTYDFYTGKQIPCSLVDVEHIFPLSKACEMGMSDENIRKLARDPDNLVFAHQTVNRSKGDALPVQTIKRFKNNPSIKFNQANFDDYASRVGVIADKYNVKRQLGVANLKLINQANRSIRNRIIIQTTTKVAKRIATRG